MCVYECVSVCVCVSVLMSMFVFVSVLVSMFVSVSVGPGHALAKGRLGQAALKPNCSTRLQSWLILMVAVSNCWQMWESISPLLARLALRWF
jgi:hypothetical protein